MNAHDAPLINKTGTEATAVASTLCNPREPRKRPKTHNFVTQCISKWIDPRVSYKTAIKNMYSSGRDKYRGI